MQASSSRVPASGSETNEKQVERSIWSHIWWRRRLLAAELAVIARTCVTHAIWGAPKSTWSLQLHLLTEIVRESAKPVYNKHASLKGLRAAVALDKRMGLPKHLRNHRLTVPIKKRGLKGILQEVDEQGSDFKLEAEWMIHDSVTEPSDRVILFLHGGAYVSMSVATHRPLCLAISKATKNRIFSVEYGQAPEHPYPQGIHHAIAAYLYLLDEGIAPENIVFSGDSAGGGLCAAVMIYIGENGLPKPAGGILISPWLDLTGTLASHVDNRVFDYITRPFDATPVNPVKFYIGERKVEETPYASPVFASDEQLATLPPILIQSGGVESLRDESSLFAARLPAGSRHEIFDHGVHVFQFFVGTPAAQAAFAAIASFEGTLPPTKSFDFSAIDAKLSASKQSADQPKKTTVVAPPFTFEAASSKGPTAIPYPRPLAQDHAPEALKQLVREWKEPADWAVYVPRWETKRSLLGSWAHL